MVCFTNPHPPCSTTDLSLTVYVLRASHPHALYGRQMALSLYMHSTTFPARYCAKRESSFPFQHSPCHKKFNLIEVNATTIHLENIQIRYLLEIIFEDFRGVCAMASPVSSVIIHHWRFCVGFYLLRPVRLFFGLLIKQVHCTFDLH